jgi:anaerobic selenocysteine-containing dehydrogenase
MAGACLGRVGIERLVAAAIRFGGARDGDGPGAPRLTLARLAAHPHGMPTRPLRPRLADRLHTRSKRIVCAPAPYTRDLPRLQRALDAEPPPDELVLIGRRHLRSNNSWLHNIPGLTGGSNHCKLQIHPRDAASRGLENGALATLRSRVAPLEVEVEVTADIASGVVSLPHGWGHRDHGGEVARMTRGVSANDVTDDARFDPVTGNAALNGVSVTVTAVPAARDPHPRHSAAAASTTPAQAPTGGAVGTTARIERL